MSDQVAEIKSKLDIVDLVGSYLPLKKKGRNHWANCPFHGEKTPSFSVSGELQIFKCFGCGMSGDIFTFLQEYEKIDFRESLEILAKKANVELISDPSQTNQDKLNQKIIQINQYTASFYHYILVKHPLGSTALNYLTNRGITDSTIKLFGIGFAPNDKKHLLAFLKSKGFSETDITKTGTFGQKGNYFYDRFRDRLIFPLVDHRDRVVAFSGRILPNVAKAAFDAAKYINSPETPVYHKGHMFYGLNLSKDHIRAKNCAIVVEGEFDLISPYQAGFKNIVALKGTAFTDQQLILLKRYTQNLILALDSDFAGINAAKKSILLADSMGFNIKAVDLKNFKDPDDAIKSDLPFFKKQVKQALSIWDFIIQKSLQTFDPTSDIGKKQILEFTFPFLTQIDNSVIKSTYLAKLANYLGVDKEAIMVESTKFSSQKNSDQKTNIVIPQKVDQDSFLKTDKFQHLIISLLFSQPNPAKFYKTIEKYLDVITLPQYQKILNYLKKYSKKTFSAKLFSSLLPPESIDLFTDIFIKSQSDPQDDIFTTKKIKSLSADIKLIDLKAKQRLLSLKIAQAETAKKTTTVKKLQLAYNQLLTDISHLQSKI